MVGRPRDEISHVCDCKLQNTLEQKELMIPNETMFNSSRLIKGCKLEYGRPGNAVLQRSIFIFWCACVCVQVMRTVPL